MNKGINDLIKLIEHETSKTGDRRGYTDYSEIEDRSRSRMLNDQFTFQPKINKKSQKISMKSANDSSHRILKGKKPVMK
jgi:hypothetical protein